MGNEIDRLEIAIEAEASKANRSLSSMEKHLDKVAEGLEKVLLLANGGLSLDKMFKGVSSANTAEKLGQQMADSLIKGFNLNRAGADVKRQVKSLSMDISKSLYSSGPNNKTTHDIERLGGIVKKHGTIAQEVSSDYKNLYDSIKAVSKIKIRPETASALGDNFKSRSGLLRTKMSTKSGIELDSIYQELRGKYPHILPDYSNVEDQFSAINNAVREYLSLKDKAFRPVTEDEAYGAVVDSVGDLNNKLKEAKATSDMVNSSMREMKSLSESFSFDTSGMNEMKKVIDSALGGGKKKNTATRIKRADLKYTETSLDDIFEKYKDAGKGIDLSGVGLPELEKMAQSTDGSIKRLNERLVKKIAIEGTKDLGKTWESLIYDIQKATNEAEAYGEAIDKIKKKRLDMSNLQINREKPPVRMKAVEKDRLPTIKGAEISKKEVGGVQAVTRELNEAIDKADSLDSSMNFDNATAGVSGLRSRITELTNSLMKMFRMDSNGNIAGIESLKNSLKSPIDLTQKSDGTDWNRALSKSSLDKMISSIQDEIGGVKNRIGSSFESTNGKRYVRLDDDVADLKQLEKELKNANKLKQTLFGSGKGSSGLSNGLNKTQKSAKSLTNTLKSTKKGISSLLSSFGQLSGRLKAPLSMMERLRNSISGVQKQSNKGMSWGRMIGSSVLFSFVFQGISAIQRAIAEGSNNLVQYSAVYNRSISSMLTSLTYLKNAWAAAFAPVINVVAQYISAFIDMIAGALNAIGKFMAALTGKGFAVQAKKVWQDYGSTLVDAGSGVGKAGDDAEKAASGIGDVGDAAKKATKDLKSYTLGIDELNVIEPDLGVNTGGSGGGTGGSGSPSGGSGGSGGIGGVSVSDMFETVKVDGVLADLGKKIREAFLAGDWEGIGEILANAANSGLQKLYDVISWDNVGPKITAFTTAFTTTFNSFVENLDWTLLGKTVGAGVNTLVNAFNLLFGDGGIDFQLIGQKISDGLLGAVNEINWPNIGTAIGNYFMIAWNTLSGIITGLSQEDGAGLTGWDNLGIAISEAINNVFSTLDFGTIGGAIGGAISGAVKAAKKAVSGINWKDLGSNIANGINKFFTKFDGGELASGISSFIKGVLDMLITVIRETDWSLIWQDIIEFIANVDILGIAGRLLVACVDLIQGILDGLWKAITSINWGQIWDNILQSFKDFFEIASPSKVMIEMGGYLIQGLVKGITAVIQTVIDVFSFVWESIKSVFSSVGSWFFGVFSDAWNSIKSVWNTVGKWFSDRWGEITKAFSPVVTWFSEKFTAAKDAVTNAWRFVGSWFSENVANPIKSTIDRLKDSIKTAFKTAYEGAVGAWDGISSKFKSIANSAIKPIGSLVNGIIDGVNWVSNKLGAGNVLNNWSVPKFAKGSGGISKDTLGMVNDQSGGTYKELIVPPHGKPFIPEGRNVVLPLQRGTKIMPAGQTKAVMNNMPKFAGGIGDFFGNAWSAIRSFTGNVLDYITHPEDIVKIAIDKFTDMSKMFEPWTTIGAGIVNKLFDTIVKKIKYLFDKFSPEGVEKAIKWAVGIANDDSHGYDQASRWGTPDYDCSSLVISAFEQAGIKLKSAGATYTGNMYNAAKSAGFTDVTASTNKATTAGMKRGDILLNRKHHTALYLGNGQIVQASSNEFGKATGGKPGDQTGREISVRSYYNYPWDDILRYVGKAYKEGVGKIGFFDIFRIPQLADGGIMSRGQIFMARENGPELVGRHGNKSVVMNNNQIVQSVSAGVGNAVDNAITRLEARLQRLEEIEEAILEKDMTVNMDGKRVDKQLAKARKNTGYNFSPSPA